MSRKTNNLRRRLAIEQQRRDTRAKLLERRVEAEQAKLRAFQHSLTWPRSVMVRVEQDWDRIQGSFDKWMACATFTPDAYLRMRMWQPGAYAENVGLMAQMIGEEIGQKVTRAILDRLGAERTVRGR